MEKEYLSYSQNRELAWLKFNERVLDEADDPAVPLMERLKFIAIFTSNLDEFFMVRVGSTFDLIALKSGYRDRRTDMTLEEQLKKIYLEVAPLYKKKNKIYKEVKTALKAHGVSSLDYNELSKNEAKYIKELYKNEIKPILSPQIVDSLHPFPHIINKRLLVIAILKYKGEQILGLVPMPASMPEVIYLPGEEVRYIRSEKVVYEFLSDIFDSAEIIEKNCICITRNADINPDWDNYGDEHEDFRDKMKKLLQKRRKLAVVRLEANYPMSKKFEEMLCKRFEIKSDYIFVSSNALKMSYVFSLLDKLTPAQNKLLSYPQFNPIYPATIDQSASVIKQIKGGDKLVFHPYENMDALLQMIKEAAYDPNVVSIKITIYRLAKKAKLVDYLCRAAENDKDVTVVMELRARFDEQSNIDWSERLEDAGCKIIYGMDKYKIHSKICLITLKNNHELSYITQIGTGNYNEKTASQYTDFSLMTANESIATDAVEFFKNVSIGNLEGGYNSLLVAPLYFKAEMLRLIDEEIQKGSEGEIFLKMNSLTDMDFVNKFVEASKAGVRVRLIIRGICCLLPGIIGVSDNITVINIVSRFLEHTRVYCFGKDENKKVYIASADLMTRNTERRIEIACPIYDEKIKTEISDIMDTLWNDNVKARVMQNDGIYIKKPQKEPFIDSQLYYIEHYKDKKSMPSVVIKESFGSKLKRMFGMK